MLVAKMMIKSYEMAFRKEIKESEKMMKRLLKHSEIKDDQGEDDQEDDQ